MDGRGFFTTEAQRVLRVLFVRSGIGNIFLNEPPHPKPLSEGQCLRDPQGERGFCRLARDMGLLSGGFQGKCSMGVVGGGEWMGAGLRSNCTIVIGNLRRASYNEDAILPLS